MNSMICPYCGNLIAYNSYFDAFYCSKCGGFFKQATVVECNDLNEPLTNAQKIRAMTDDELNELFHEIYNAGAEDAVSYVWGNRTNNFEWTMEWLQRPAEEDDHIV